MQHRKSFRCFFIAVLMLLSTIVPVQAATWLPTFTDVDRYYVDNSDIQADDYTVTFWEKTVYTDSFKHDGIKTIISQTQGDFINYKARPLKIIAYYEDGRVYSFASSPWIDFEEPSILSAQIGSALENYLIQRNWIPISGSISVFNPKIENGHVIYWCRTVNDGAHSYWLYKCDPASKKYEPLACAGKNGLGVSKALRGIRSYEPNSLMDFEVNKVLDIILNSR